MSKPSTAKWIVDDLLTNWKYFADDDPVIPALWVPGSCRLFLVLGENAGGKSFFRRCVQICAKENTSIEEVIHISMEGRGGGNYLGPLHGLIYGDEHHDSTGSNSATTVKTAIETCRKREHPHLMYWDEPDLGMSEGASLGAAIVIADFVENLPDHTKGIFITTHSRPMIAELAKLDPHYLHLGTLPKEAPENLQAWLEREIVPVSPEEVRKRNIDRYRAIQKILNDKRARQDG